MFENLTKLEKPLTFYIKAFPLDVKMNIYKGSKININNLCEQFIKKTVYRQSLARKSIFLYLLSNS